MLLAHGAEAVAEATEALCGFFVGFGVEPDRYDRLIERLVAEGLADRRRQDQNLADLVMLDVERDFERWLETVIGPEFLAGQPALPIGRAAFLACGGPVEWRDLLLAPEPLPASFLAAMRAAAPTPSPLPTPATMLPQSLDSWSLSDAAGLLRGVLESASIARPLLAASIRLTKPLS